MGPLPYAAKGSFVLSDALGSDTIRAAMTPQPIPDQDERIGEFQRKHRTSLVTLVFTDMVGSTARKQQLGDRSSAEVFRQHHQIVRETLGQFPQGEEIKTVGEGVRVCGRQGLFLAGYRWASHFTSLGATLSVGELPNLFGSMLAEYLIITGSNHFLVSA